MVELVECEGAEDLLNELRPRSDQFRDLHDASQRFQQYVFRGHEDDRFGLLPTALRVNKHVWIKSRFGSGIWGRAEPNPENAQLDRFVQARDRMVVTKSWFNRHQVWAEVLMLNDFFQFADASGLPLPEDSQNLRSALECYLITLRNLKDEAGHLRKWPPPDLLSLLALAQHYGVPTRLLDWSRSAYSAAYFAAEGAARRLTNEKSSSSHPLPTHLSVWAFNIEAYNVRRLAGPLGNRGQERVTIITAPSAGNPNLHLQKGLFTLYQPKSVPPGGRVDRTPLDSAIRPVGVGSLFKRFRLPIHQAKKLLRLLFFEGVSGASVYAGYRGAAQATMEQIYWDNWDRPGDIWQRFQSADD